MQAKILKWGNSLGIRLSGKLKALTCFKPGVLVDVDIRDDGLFIKKSNVKNLLPFSEGALLDDLSTCNTDLLAIPTDKEWDE